MGHVMVEGEGGRRVEVELTFDVDVDFPVCFGQVEIVGVEGTLYAAGRGQHSGLSTVLCMHLAEAASSV